MKVKFSRGKDDKLVSFEELLEDEEKEANVDVGSGGGRDAPRQQAWKDVSGLSGAPKTPDAKGTKAFERAAAVRRCRQAYGGPDNPPMGSTVMGIFEKWDEIEEEAVDEFEDDPNSIDDFAGHSMACTKCGWRRALDRAHLDASKKYQRQGMSTWTCESALLDHKKRIFFTTAVVEVGSL